MTLFLKLLLRCLIQHPEGTIRINRDGHSFSLNASVGSASISFQADWYVVLVGDFRKQLIDVLAFNLQIRHCYVGNACFQIARR